MKDVKQKLLKWSLLLLNWLFDVQGTVLITQKLLEENRSMQLSNRPISPSRPVTPSRLTVGGVLGRKQPITKSPFKEYYDSSRQNNQYITNHLQRKCSSPLKSPLRSQSPMTRKNTYQSSRSNNRSPLKFVGGFGNVDNYYQSRMPESCYVPSTFVESTYNGKQNTKSNVPALFSAIVKDQNIKSQNCGNYQRKKSTKEGVSFMSLIKKQHSLGVPASKQNQQSNAFDRPNNEKCSIAATDYSSGKKLSFKDSLKEKPKEVQLIQSLKAPPVILQKSACMLESTAVSVCDRVNESVVENSFMDLNMDPCFDM